MTIGDDDRIMSAVVRNNAEWCDLVCRTHGLPGEFRIASWTSAERTPPLYPDAVTLSRTAAAADILPWIDTAPGCSVKDSFGVLDLAQVGFEILLDSWWIHRPPDLERPARAIGVSWSALRTAEALAAWQEAWSEDGEPGPFRPELLADPSVRVVAGYRDGQVAAGAVLNRAAAVVGVSNMFAVDGDLDAAWAGVLALAARDFPGLPAVGYESGHELDFAVRNGFTPVGQLRVWLLRD